MKGLGILVILLATLPTDAMKFCFSLFSVIVSRKLKSPPAQNAFPAPVRITTLTAGSSAATQIFM